MYFNDNARSIKKIKTLLVMIFLLSICCSSCSNGNKATFDSTGNVSECSSNSDKTVSLASDTSNDYSSSFSDNSTAYYVPSFSSSSTIFYWRDSSSELRFGTCVLNNSGPSLDLFNEMQTSKNCSLSTMKKVVGGHGGSSSNKIFEINYPMAEEDVRAFGNMAYPSFPSRDLSIYEQLDLLNIYYYFYDGSEQIYANMSECFKGEEDKCFDIYSKYFTNLSHIYCWEDNGNYYCGIAPEKDDDVVDLTPIRYFQEFLPCSLSNMKKIIQKYYGIININIDNYIIETPLIKTAADWRDYVKSPYPNNISSNKLLYEELGIEEAFRKKFDL